MSSNFQTLPYQAEIAQRMTFGSEHRIPVTAEFYQTTNGYWVAWQADGLALVLPPNWPENEPADHVEGAENLFALCAFIESGEYETAMASDEECICDCGDIHHHH